MFKAILQRLDDLAKLSPTQKAPLLKQYMAEQPDHFKSIIRFMLDPFITFGVNTFPVPSKEHWFNPPVPDQALAERFYSTMFNLRDRELTGNAAREALTQLVIRGVPSELLYRILNKDPRAGFGMSTIQKLCPGLIAEFPYMRCSLPAKASKNMGWRDGVFSEIKADGMFGNLNRDKASNVWLTSRQGTLIPIDRFPALLSEAQHIPLGHQLHGELEVYENGALLSREIGNGLINSIVQGESLPEGFEIIFQAWDCIPLTAVVAKGKYTIPYHVRFKAITDAFMYDGPIRPIEHRIVYSREEAKEHFKRALAEGREGTVYKDRNMFWKDGTSTEQIKMKMTAPCDLKIIGYRAGKGNRANGVGSVLCASSDGLLRVAVSGFNGAILDYINANQEALLGTIMCVKFNMITEPSPSNDLYSLFLPRFVELRKDKTEADSLQKIKDEYASALENV